MSRTVAMIFAAGLGTRLMPLTKEKPKALVEVAGHTMLEHVIRHLIKAGINDIVINVHHFAPKIIDFLRDNNNFGANIKISDETQLLLDTGGALAKAYPLLKNYDNILIHNADILTDLNLTDMLAFHETTGSDATLLISNRQSSRYLYFDRNNMRLNGWANHKTGDTLPSDFSPNDYTGFAFGGIHIMRNSMLANLKKYNSEDVFSIIPFYIDSCRKTKITGYYPNCQYQWFDIGSPEKLRYAEHSFIQQI